MNFPNPQCEFIHHVNSYYTQILFGIGAFASVTKIFIGYIVLKKMKKSLNESYFKIRKSVVCTILITLLVITLNFLYNYFLRFRLNIWLIFLASLKGEAEINEIIVAVITLLNSYLEVFLM